VRSERAVAELKAQYEARLEARAIAAIDRAKILQDHIDDLRSEIAHLRDELRQARMAASEAINAGFVAARMPPPHATRPPRIGPLHPVTPIRTWDQTRIELEAAEAGPVGTKDLV